MKKRILKSLAVIMLMMMCMPQVFALSEIRVRVNGTQVYFPDGKPYVDSNSRVLVPVRFVSEQLGAKVEWDSAAKRVTIIDGDKVAILNINSKQIMVNGQVKELDTAAIVKGTRTYVPIRFVSEALGATVKWDNKVRIVYIDNGKAPLPEVKVFEAGPFTVPITADSRVTKTQSASKITTESLMQVYTDTSDGIIILVTQGMKVDYSIQCDAAEELLQQVLSPSEAKRIIDFARTKKSIRDKIGEKTFDTENYIFEVSGDSRSVNIRVYKK